MPEIINDSKQKKALQQVSDGLAAVETINTLLRLYQNDDGFVVAPVSRRKPSVTLIGTEAARVRTALANERERLARGIRTTAKKQRIALSEEDEDILRGEAAESPSEAAGAPQDDEASATRPETEGAAEDAESGETGDFN